jgi:hypothetical protein
VALTAPGSNERVAGVVAVSATAEDDMAVARVEFYADGALIGTDTSAPYEVSWDSTTVAGGSHTLVAKAYDAGGRHAHGEGLRQSQQCSHLFSVPKGQHTVTARAYDAAGNVTTSAPISVKVN